MNSLNLPVNLKQCVSNEVLKPLGLLSRTTRGYFSLFWCWFKKISVMHNSSAIFSSIKDSQIVMCHTTSQKAIATEAIGFTISGKPFWIHGWKNWGGKIKVDRSYPHICVKLPYLQGLWSDKETDCALKTVWSQLPCMSLLFIQNFNCNLSVILNTVQWQCYLIVIAWW